jgi:hypothetical protein
LRPRVNPRSCDGALDDNVAIVRAAFHNAAFLGDPIAELADAQEES